LLSKWCFAASAAGVPSLLLQLCKSIPKGKVSTYGAMAAVLQSSARAVGQVGALVLLLL
jgi:alkylated DNA nucleotide flippase Atl1